MSISVAEAAEEKLKRPLAEWIAERLRPRTIDGHYVPRLTWQAIADELYTVTGVRATKQHLWAQYRHLDTPSAAS